MDTVGLTVSFPPEVDTLLPRCLSCVPANTDPCFSQGTRPDTDYWVTSLSSRGSVAQSLCPLLIVRGPLRSRIRKAQSQGGPGRRWLPIGASMSPRVPPSRAHILWAAASACIPGGPLSSPGTLRAEERPHPSLAGGFACILSLEFCSEPPCGPCALPQAQPAPHPEPHWACAGHAQRMTPPGAGSVPAG